LVKYYRRSWRILIASRDDDSRSQLSSLELFALGLKELRRARLIEAEGLGEIIDAALKATTSEYTNHSPDRDSSDLSTCYISLKQLVMRIPYSEKTLRNLMSAGDLVEGKHFFKRRGRVMFSWSAMREWVEWQESEAVGEIPLVRNRKNGREG
jgi:hypothetical protein